MWAAKPRSSQPWEPVELVILKQKLAKLSRSICKCLADRPTSTPVAFPVYINPNDKEIQVEEPKRTFDRFTQASQDSIRKDREELTTSLTKDVLCPSCFVTMNLLRGGTLKILKDEQSETKNDMFSCDKATEKNVTKLEKTTSFTNKCNLLTSLSGECDNSLHLDMKGMHQVTFGEVTVNSQQQNFPMDSPPCFCLAKFVDSIRPPMMNFYA